MKRYLQIFSALALCASFIFSGHAHAFLSNEKNVTVHREWQITHYNLWQITPDHMSVRTMQVDLPSVFRVIEERTAHRTLGLNLHPIQGVPNVLEVSSVSEPSPGGLVGIREGDIIGEVNGKIFTFGNSFDYPDFGKMTTQEKQKWFDEHDRRWRESVDLPLTEKSDQDLTLSVFRDGITHHITIKRRWIEEFRLHIDLRLAQKKNMHTITIRVLPKHVVSIPTLTHDEFEAQFQRYGYVMALYGIAVPASAHSAHASSGEDFTIGRARILGMGGVHSQMDPPDKYQKALRWHDIIANAKKPLVFTLEIFDVYASAPSSVTFADMVPDDPPWPWIETLVLNTKLVDVYEEK
jgi:hypothetical protein